MDGRLVPDGYGDLSPFVLNLFENVAAVQFDHRALAIATLAVALVLWLRAKGRDLSHAMVRALDLVLLTYVGAHAPDEPTGLGVKFIVLGQIGTLYYFVHFLIILPLLGKIERPRPLPASIAGSVLSSQPGGGAVASGAPAKPMEKA